MKLDYESQFQQMFRPGDRVWVSGFRIASGGRKIIRNREPMLAEICVCHRRDDEEKLRSMGKLPAYVVPVNPDGTLRFKDACTYADLNFVKTEEEAKAYYKSAVLAAHTIVRHEMKRLGHTKARVKEIIKSLGVDPDTLDEQTSKPAK